MALILPFIRKPPSDLLAAVLPPDIELVRLLTGFLLIGAWISNVILQSGDEFEDISFAGKGELNCGAGVSHTKEFL